MRFLALRFSFSLFVLCFTLLSACGTTQDGNTKSEARNPKQIQNPNDQVEKIQLLINQLDDNKPAVRETATNELILIGKPAEPYLQDTLKTIKGKNAEVEWRTKFILKANSIRERVKFPDVLLKRYPYIYRDLANDVADRKFDVLRQITEMDEIKKPMYDITEDNIAYVIGELLSDGGKKLNTEQKHEILDVSRGVRWHKNVQGSAPYVKILLKDGDAGVRVRALHTLGELGAKDAIPDIRDMLKDDDEGVCMWAVSALRQLGVSEEEIEKAKSVK